MNASRPGNVCPICKKAFTRKADCTRHTRLHAGIKPYLCEVAGCGKRFAQYTALKTHRNVHTGLKPFSCGFPGCKSAFGDPSSCARHRKEMHYPRQPFKCFVEGCVSSILRSSAFKAHLRKHGLDPETYGDVFKRNCPPVVACGSVQVEGIMEERITGLQGSSYSQATSLPSLPDCWDSLLSFPADSSAFLGMQTGHSTGFSCSSPMLLAPSPRIAQGSDAGYFLTPARALSATSSQYSSPLLMTPALTPTTGMEIMSDVGIHLSPCFMTRDWAPSAWQDHGTLSVG